MLLNEKQTFVCCVNRDIFFWVGLLVFRDHVLSIPLTDNVVFIYQAVVTIGCLKLCSCSLIDCT